MFIVFEGIDGSGKTSLSNRVARALRARGKTVEHLREGGRFGSKVTQAIRELGRDARHFELAPTAELLIYAAREAQLVAEVLRPSLEKNDLTIADRFVYTALTLSTHGRGLPRGEVEPAVRAAQGGVEPDLVLLIDVDPWLARARRKISKLNTPDARPSSRKSLSGDGLQARLREGYLELARRDPARWLVVSNDDANLDQLEAHLLRVIEAAHTQGIEAARRLHEDEGRPRASDTQRPRDLTGSGPFVERPEIDSTEWLACWAERRAAAGEADLAAYVLDGLAGPRVDPLRRRLAATSPQVIAAGLKWQDDEESWALREQLRATAPEHVARSLTGLCSPRADAMRAALIERAPGAVALSLSLRDDDFAWQLRTAALAADSERVLSSLRQLDSDRAWQLRESLIERRGGARAFDLYETAKALADSVIGLDDPRAWAIRGAARAAAPVAAIQSLAALTSGEAWAWRDRHVAFMPKTVIGTLEGLEDPRAFAMRQALAPSVAEVLESMVGLDGPEAWQIRDASADRWPSGVVKSLGLLSRTERGRALIARQLARYPEMLPLRRQVSLLGCTV